ncbi:MAG: oxidoreductase [Bacteroidales bacterium]
MQKTALVFGATGLVGNFLVNELAANEIYEKVKVFNRRKQQYNHNKITEIQIDFDKIGEYIHEFKGHDAYCCLGTTLRKAGSKENFFKIDHDLPLEIAKICSTNEVSSFIGISSIGANADSSNYYLRTKGLMELHIQELDFDQLAFVRPSMLVGPRIEFRFGELFGKIIMTPINYLLVGKLKKYRSIHSKTVAKAMIQIANMPMDKLFYESDELLEIAKIE